VITKTEPNGFVGTDLAEVLERLGVDHLHVVGMMTSTCVDATVRATTDLGQNVTLVHHGCAAPDLSSRTSPYPVRWCTLPSCLPSRTATPRW